MDSYNPSHYLLKHFQKTQCNLYGFMNTCSLSVSSPFGGVAGSHARGDANAPRGFPAHSHVLSQLASLTINGALASRIEYMYHFPLPPSLLLSQVYLGING